MRREMWYNANHLYKEVREMKRSLSVFLIAALLLGICAVPALAAAPTVRADVPAASLRQNQHVVRNARFVHQFDSAFGDQRC